MDYLNFSSNINEGIKAVLFFYEKISHTQKAQKALKNVNKQLSYTHKKAQKANKQLSRRYFLYVQKAQNAKQAIFTQTFYTHKKHKKHKMQTSDFLPLRCFLCE